MRDADDLPRLLKRLYRFRQRRPRLFARRRKAALLAEFARAWPGGYVALDDGGLAFIPAPLDSQGERVAFYGLAAPSAALAFAPPGGTVIDVGANLGEWAVPLARAVGPGGRLLAIEPNPPVAAALAATLRINKLDQATVLGIALSDRDGTGSLSVDPRHTALSRLTGDRGTPTPLRRLDGVVYEAGLTRIDLIKIDVEGHERAVLAGAAESLAGFRPPVIFESGHETREDRLAIAQQLTELGYEIIAVLHDYGALSCSIDDYAAAAGPCAGGEARNILALTRR